jgi:retinol dehydrogenase 14
MMPGFFVGDAMEGNLLYVVDCLPVQALATIVPMTGKTVLITGATNGIGLESAAVLAGRGAHVILVGRDAGRVAQAQATVKTRCGAETAAYVCDFASLKDVNQLADRVLRDVSRLDVLINNAGSVFARRTVTVDGYEATFAVNHLSHFLLTTRLLPLLTASTPARIIAVASGGHRQGTMDFDNLHFERGYQIMRAYTRSKLANVLLHRNCRAAWPAPGSRRTA